MQVAVRADPRAHQFQIRLSVAAAAGAPEFRLPVWIRGSYLVRDFAKHVSGLTASRAGVPVAIERLDKSRFRLPPGAGEVVLEYSVHALDESVRKAWLDSRRGFFNSSSLVYCPVGHEQAGFELELVRPEDPDCADWQLATALQPLQVDAAGFGRYAAPDYETLIDSPVEMAAFRRIDFVADGVPHTLTLSGRCEPDAARLAADLAKVCTVQREMFGHQPALPRYWFLTNVTGAGYGGLEHRESTALVCARNDLPRPGDSSLSKEYRTFLGLASHEYFHLWNVKRITPAAFADSDLSGPAYTRDLWHYEGVTSYYDDLFLLRAGLIDAPSYLDLVAEAATRLERTPARQVHSLADASFEAWIKYYQPDDNSPNASTNYYVKGALVALCLDLRLRRDSEISLDDVLRTLWCRYGREERPAPEGALEAVAIEQSGLDLRDFFDQALRGTGELPLAEALAEFGVIAERRPAVGDGDQGGRRSGTPQKQTLGLKLNSDGKVAHVLAGSAAQRAGLAAGDQLLALDGLKLAAGQLSARVDALRPKLSAELLWFRGDELMRAAIIPEPAAADTWTLTLMEVAGAELNPAVAARRKTWLGV
ncbi:MAG: PDZ domain-containing protein [Stagnimonas sp.]|nr:PDZ domain-containing protein [Stagnimonas sp.]